MLGETGIIGEPCRIVVAGIMVQGFLRAAMMTLVALMVAAKAQFGDDLRSLHRLLVDAGRHVARPERPKGADVK